jgi:hypothetical protein
VGAGAEIEADEPADAGSDAQVGEELDANADAAAADPGASAGADAEEPAARAGKRSGSKPRKHAPKATVVVHVRLSGIGRAELRIGKQTIRAVPHFDGRLPVGRHRVSWRERADDSWHAAGSFTFVDGSEYIVRVSANGPRLETR